MSDQLFVTSFIFLLVYTVSSQSSPCKRGWVRLEDSCYLFSRYTSSWPEALGTCMAFESSLVSIGNSEENSAISVHLSKLHPIDKDRNHSDFWIGGNDIEYEGHFRWISSESDFGFTDWDDGQPDAPKYKQDCVQMQGLKAYKWHDDLCTLNHYFICEQEINEGPSIIGR